MQSNLVDRFEAFVLSERERYYADDNNLFASSLGHVGRYLRFIEIAKSRYIMTGEKVTQRFQAVMAVSRHHPNGTRELTGKEANDLRGDVNIHINLHYEIESFCLFAKILLDTIARCIWDYFGHTRGITITSHTTLQKHLDKYAKDKDLQIPDNMNSIIEELTTSVIEYRDKHISHQHNPRTIHTTHILIGKGTRIGGTALYRKQTDKYFESPNIEHIYNVIEQYIEQIQILVQTNHAKSRYRLRSV